MLSDLGFKEINIISKTKSKDINKAWNAAEAAEVVFSAYIQALKPNDISKSLKVISPDSQNVLQDEERG